ncbi:MAG: tetratricopeptide repeat protein [Acidimicrobiales bacterium]
MSVVDVTDATFESEVLDRSDDVPVVVDLWAPWCGPCRTLGPLIEKVVGDTGGQVVLTKVNVDENPQISASFQVQSIPAVYALRDHKVVDGFIGAQGESFLRQWVDGLLPSQTEREIKALIDAGDEASLRQAVDLDPGNEAVIVALAELLVGQDGGDEAQELLARVPETAETRRVGALARVGHDGGEVPDDDNIEQRLRALLDQVKADEEARQQYLDLLELLGPDDPRTAQYRRELATRIY